MNLKVYFLNSHIECFHENLGAYSEEQSERFHQDVRDIERPWNADTTECGTSTSQLITVGGGKERMEGESVFGEHQREEEKVSQTKGVNI